MRKIVLVCFLLLYSICSNKPQLKEKIITSSCPNILLSQLIKTNTVEREIKVRLTVYWARGGDTDGDTAKKKSSSGTKLREGVSVAVDPKLIPFYKRMYIPNLGIRVAHDTGTAVKSKKATNGKLPVIDVFFNKKRDALKFAYNNPKIVKVSIYKY